MVIPWTGLPERETERVMLKRRPEYFAVFALSAIAAIVVAILTAISLDTGTPSLSGKREQDAAQIVLRASDLIGLGNEDKLAAVMQVSYGSYSAGDFVLSVMTSPEYLIKSPDDKQFAKDLCNVIYGTVDDGVVAGITQALGSYNRMMVIDDVISQNDRKFAVTGRTGNGPGSVITGINIDQGLAADDEYTVGIKEISGSFSATGDEIRTDLFVDGALYRGYLKYDKGSSGTKGFVLAWDTAGFDPGDHEVSILLRSSDGRGVTVAGGKVRIPKKERVENFSVEDGVIEKGQQTAWFILDSEDSDCYVNFAGISEKISVSLYDLSGKLIGTNASTSAGYAALRAKKQDTDKAVKETGIPGVSNCFYICARRIEGDNETGSGEVSFKMVQSRDVAYHEGKYVSVAPGKTEDRYTLTDELGNEYQADKDKVKILPFNASLSHLDIKSSNAGDKGVYPSFDVSEDKYGYYSAVVKEITIECESVEGYAAKYKITAENNGSKTEIQPGKPFTLSEGETVIKAEVISFDGQTGSCDLYVLTGKDSGNFFEETLSQFPESYYSGLWLMHCKHPSYRFRAYNTNVSFAEALKAETTGNRSLVSNGHYPQYVKEGSPVYDKPDWKAAKTEVVSYYLDPRNFFTDKRIFMFELLGFDESVHTKDGLKRIISGSFMDTDDFDYVTTIYNAGRQAGVSPYCLAGRIIQEMGFSGRSALCKGTVTGYEGYYNFYNIGSVSTTKEGGATVLGAKYAKWGREPEKEEISEAEAKLLLPWNTKEKAITGGALWIASGYIDKGQNTLYFQKFDVLDDGTVRYNHQYAQNIMMAYTEALRYYNSYDSINKTDSAFVFVIPVYSDMPAEYGYLP